MGATKFCTIAQGHNVNEVFNRLVEEAKREYGTDCYNGTISTCTLHGTPAKTFENYKPENDVEAVNYVQRHNYGEKWVANFIDLGVCGYEIVEVSRNRNDNTATFAKMHVVYNEDGKAICKEKQLKVAKEKAVDYALEHGCDVHIKYEYIKVQGSSVVCEYTCKRTFSKTMPYVKENQRRKIVPVHKYMFYGWAAC